MRSNTNNSKDEKSRSSASSAGNENVRQAFKIVNNRSHTAVQQLLKKTIANSEQPIQAKSDGLALNGEAEAFGFKNEELLEIKNKITGSDDAVQQKSIGNVVQKKSHCQGLNSVTYSKLNSHGKRAYNLLDNQRAGFASIDKTGGGVNAKTDGESRVVSAERMISATSAARSSDQTTIGWLGRLEEGQTSGYDGGHLIASSLGGPGTWGNMVPQDYFENRWGDWRKYEREVKAAIAVTGSPPILKVNLGYSGDSVLPDKWDSWLEDTNGTNVNWYSAKWT